MVAAAAHIGVTPRVLRYWEEQQLISPTREHGNERGKLRYSPPAQVMIIHAN